MKTLNVKILLLFLAVCISQVGWGQVTLVNYNFNSGASDAALTPTLASNISSIFSSTEVFATFGGVASGAGAFTVNATAGNARAMSNSSGTNTRYFQVQLGGTGLSSYKTFKIYCQAQRSGTGASTITLAYSTDGISYTNFATTGSPGNGSFSQISFDLTSISSIDKQSSVYFRILASGGTSATGTLRIDNLQIQGVYEAPSNYTLTFDGNSNTSGSAPSSGSYSSGSSVTLPINTGILAKTGFTFNGWNTNAAGTGFHYDAGSSFTMPSANTTLYAEWVSVSTYSLTYDGNGNTSGSVPSSGSYSDGATVTLPTNTGILAKTGFVFNGWNTNTAGTGTHYNVGASYTMPSANTTLYAEWAAIPTYTVTYNANGGTGTQTDPSSPYTSSSSVTVLSNSYTRSGYTFVSWNTASDGTGTSYSPSATFTIGANTTLYAQWNLANVDCGDLFISEYVEGTGNNKYIEIFNPTNSSINLSSYSLRLYSNGGTTPSEAALSGTIAAYGTVVYKNNSAVAYSGSATVSPQVNFNGDDAIALAKSGVNIDIFGRIGEDPGTAWTSTGYSTLDKTLVRKLSVKYGVNTNPTSGFPTLSTEWDVYNTDVVTNLGLHTSGCAPTAPEINIKQGSNDIASGGSYDFSDQFVGTVSGVITFTIENTGNTALNLTGTPKVTKSGASAADFTVDQTATSSSVGASSSTTFTITFTPSATGTRTASISIANSDSDENPYVITLLGNGIVYTGPSTGIYNWMGASGGSWATSSNWSPSRTVIAASDKINISNFTGSIINVPTQEIDKLNITNSIVNLSPAAANNVLTIGSSAGTDFVLDAASKLTINSANAMTISLTGTNLGSVYGEIVFSNAGHRIVASSSSTPLTFYSGSTITQAGTGSIFGSTIANSVVFNSGATYVQVSGTNPFVLAPPSSVVTYDPNAKFVIATNSLPSLAGRTYPILVMKSGFSISGASGTTTLTLGGLIVEYGASMNLSGATYDVIISGTSSIAGTMTWPSSPSVIQNNGTFNTNSSGTSTYTILNLTNNGTYNVNSNTLNVTGALVNNGIINIADGGSLLQTSTSANSGGTYNITKAATNINDWSFYSSPVSAAPLSNLGNSIKYAFNESAANSYTNGWFAPSGTLDVGKGYLAFPTRVTFSGIANNGTLPPVTVSYTSTGDVTADGTAAGWNLVGNPYPSSISKSGLNSINSGKIEGGANGMYVWKSNGAGFVDNYTNVGASDIPSGQGFFIKVTSGTTSLTFNNTIRGTANSSTQFFRTENGVAPRVNLRLDNGKDWQEIQVGLEPTATDGFDSELDARVFNGNPSISFYSESAGRKLAIQALASPVDGSKVVPLYYSSTKGGTYKITQFGYENPDPSVTVYLKDKTTGVETDLTTTTVVSAVLAKGSDINRFDLVFRQAAVTGSSDNVINGSLNVYTSNETLNVSFTNPSSSTADVYVFNTLGSEILKSNNVSTVGTKSFATSNLNKGVYIVKVGYANGKVENRKIVIE